MKYQGFLIAAPQSGSGKTTVSLAIMAALVRRALTVAPFKCGPDFIDPGYHRAVTGQLSINLDAWMCGEEFVRQTFQAYMTRLNSRAIAIIEGAMGLFDGIGASSREGSSAQIAAITGAPVVLVVNARGMAASATALVKGFVNFDPQVKLAGVIFNNVGSDSHAELLRNAMADTLPDIAVFGCIPRDETLAIPSRHLGLVTAEDNHLTDQFTGQLAYVAERYLDLNQLAGLSFDSTQPTGCTKLMRDGRVVGGVKSVLIAVARDSAFCFMYEDNLRLLQEAGAELTFFSPLKDVALPEDIHGIYLPGGYPELYALKLSENMGFKKSIRSAVESGMPTYAECGGFVYLTEGVDAFENQPAVEFAGVFPVRCRMLPRRKALGYREAELTECASIGVKGDVVRGHEFHYSEIAPMPECVDRSYRVSRLGVELGMEGFRANNCLASYIHVHFGSNEHCAHAFVMNCIKFRDKLDC